MKLKVNYSKQTDKFLKKNTHTVTKTKVIELIKKAALVLILKESANIDLKSLHGEYKGYFRIRYRDVRIIFSILDSGEIVIVNITAIDYRGSVY